MQLTKYKTPKGKNFLYKYRAYAGINPYTGKKVFIEKRGFKSKAECKLDCTRALAKIEKDGFRKTSAKTFDEVYQLWLKDFKLTVKESSYVKLLQKFNKHIIPAFGKKEITKITVVEIQEFANHMREINSQYKEYISNVSRIFDFAIKMDLMDANPVKKISVPRKKKNLSSKKINFFTKEELKIFLDYAKENESSKVYTFFYVMANTGVRTGELLGLQWSAINFNTNTLEISQTLTRGKNRRLYLEEPKTKNSVRTIPLSDTTVAVLKEWRKHQLKEMLQLGFNTNSSNQLVFSNIENNFIQLTQPRLWFQRITKRTSLPALSPHSLRHTFATILINQGVNPKTVSELLGHSSVFFTLDIYAGCFAEEKENTINLLEKVLE